MTKYILTMIAAALFSNFAFSDINATTMPATTAAPAYQSKTTASISIAARDNLIVATAITKWDPQATNDTLAINWAAPQGSYCQNSSFPVTRGTNLNHDVFWAYRTVVHTTASGNSVTCLGHWIAQVVNTSNNQVLASAAFDVVANNGMPVAPAQPANGTATTTTAANTGSTSN